MDESFQLRPAVAADVPALRDFIEPFVSDNRLLPRTADELEDLFRNGFVVERNGQIVGCAVLEIYSSKLAEIRSLAVAADLQGQGIGRSLVEACVEEARKRNVLEVMAITSAEGFFRDCGFDFTLPGEKKALFLKTRDEA